MIYWSFISFVVALASGLFGFGGSTGGSVQLAQTLFFVFLALSVAFVAASFAREPEGSGETE